MWVYSNSNILSARNIEFIESFRSWIISENKSYLNLEDGYENQFTKRFSHGVGFLYFMFAILIIVLIILQLTLSLVFTRIFKIVYLFLTCGGQKGKKEHLDQQ